MEKIDIIRNNLFQTTEIMKENIQHLLVRGEKLQELEQKTWLLRETSTRFKQSTTSLKRKFWWVKNKTKLLIGSITLGTLVTTTAVILI